MSVVGFVLVEPTCRTIARFIARTFHFSSTFPTYFLFSAGVRVVRAFLLFSLKHRTFFRWLFYFFFPVFCCGWLIVFGSLSLYARLCETDYRTGCTDLVFVIFCDVSLFAVADVVVVVVGQLLVNVIFLFLNMLFVWLQNLMTFLFYLSLRLSHTAISNSTCCSMLPLPVSHLCHYILCVFFFLLPTLFGTHFWWKLYEREK